MAKRDMVFCVLFVGDEPLIRHLVTDSITRLGAADEWREGIRQAGLVRLRVMFFLLMDRDVALKQKIMQGWPELCVLGIEAKKANTFFGELATDVIEPWLVDERRCDDDLLSKITDLYLVS